MLASQCGIDHSTMEQSAAYINSWIGKLQGDVSLIVSAAGKAQRAVDRILGVAAEQASSDEIAA